MNRPNSIYAWLPKDSRTKLPAMKGNIMTIAGFMQTDNTTMMYTHEDSTTSEIFITYVDDYLLNSPALMKTIAIIDNSGRRCGLFSQISSSKEENDWVEK